MERPKDKRIRAAVYCRVSGKHEDQAYSLDNQIRHYMECDVYQGREETTGCFSVAGFVSKDGGVKRSC
jgi:predicted site-specific integrase-resolvase